MTTVPELIAEIAQAHEGSLGMAHAYVEQIAAAGATTAKFQVHLADKESSPLEKFRVKIFPQDKDRLSYWRRMEFTAEQWAGLKEHCDRVGLRFLASPFSVAAVELLERLGVDRYKIASGEIDDFLMLERIGRTRKPVLISTGMSSYAEIVRTVGFFSRFGNPYSLFQCTTSYPTPPERVGLNVLGELRRRFSCPVGLSDHSGTIFPSLAATVLGADHLEVHVVFDRRSFGPDAGSSLEFAELKLLAGGIRFLSACAGSPVEKDANQEYAGLREMFGKSLSAGRALRAGERIDTQSLESRKPGGVGIPASQYESVVGRTLARDLPEGKFINEEDMVP